MGWRVMNERMVFSFEWGGPEVVAHQPWSTASTNRIRQDTHPDTGSAARVRAGFVDEPRRSQPGRRSRLSLSSADQVPLAAGEPVAWCGVPTDGGASPRTDGVDQDHKVPPTIGGPNAICHHHHRSEQAVPGGDRPRRTSTLEVPAGSIYGFLGANGAGKTTAIKILAGLTRPDERDSATVAGVPLERRRGLQASHRLSRPGATLLRLDVRPRDASLRRRLLPVGRGPDRAPHRRRSSSWSGSTDAADRPTRTYSGGMRQRLGIAQALIGRPRCSCSTSRPARSTRSAGVTSSTSWSGSAARPRSSTPPTSSTTSSACRDHVAILDHGRLVRAAPTQELLAQLHPRPPVAVVGPRRDRIDGRRSRRAARGRVRRARVADARASHLRRPDATRHDRRSSSGRSPATPSTTISPRVGTPRARRSRGRLPSPHRLQGARSMNATTANTLEYVPAPTRCRARLLGPPQPRSQGRPRVAPRQANLDRGRRDHDGHRPRRRERGDQPMGARELPG